MPEFTMERLRNLALGTIIALNAVATVTSFAESYYGNYRWAEGHEITGIMGGVWPLMIDLIILVAEAGLFVAHHDKWKMRHKAWLWTVMFTALGVSVGANTGHVRSSDYLTHLTAALAPVALMFTMTVGFGVMKRTFLNKRPAAAQPAATITSQPRTPPPAPVLTIAETPSQPESEKRSQPAESEVTESVPLATTTVSPDSTMIDPNMKVIPGKSFTQPRDPRQGLSLAELRVRDMYDVNPDISVNAVKDALGVAWATAKKMLDATKEARGPVTA